MKTKVLKKGKLEEEPTALENAKECQSVWETVSREKANIAKNAKVLLNRTIPFQSLQIQRQIKNVTEI